MTPEEFSEATDKQAQEILDEAKRLTCLGSHDAVLHTLIAAALREAVEAERRAGIQAARAVQHKNEQRERRAQIVHTIERYRAAAYAAAEIAAAIEARKAD